MSRDIEHYRIRQACWCEDNEISTGTVVTVTRCADDYEGGWGCHWTQSMTNNVGAHLKVRRISNVYGIELSDTCFYPFFVLEKSTGTPTVEPRDPF